MGHLYAQAALGNVQYVCWAPWVQPQAGCFCLLACLFLSEGPYRWLRSPNTVYGAQANLTERAFIRKVFWLLVSSVHLDGKGVVVGDGWPIAAGMGKGVAWWRNHPCWWNQRLRPLDPWVASLPKTHL